MSAGGRAYRSSFLRPRQRRKAAFLKKMSRAGAAQSARPLPVAVGGLTDADGRADAAQITHFD